MKANTIKAMVSTIEGKAYAKELTKSQLNTVAKVLIEYDYAVRYQKGFNASFIANAVKNGANFEDFRADSDGLVYVWKIGDKKPVKISKKEDKKMSKKVAAKPTNKKEDTTMTKRQDRINKWCEEQGYSADDRKAYGEAMRASREYLRTIAKKTGKYFSTKKYHQIQDAMVDLMLDEGYAVDKAFKKVTGEKVEPVKKAKVATKNKKSTTVELTDSDIKALKKLFAKYN